MSGLTLFNVEEQLQWPLDEAAVEAVRKLLITNRNVEDEHYDTALTTTAPLLFQVLQSGDTTEKTKLRSSDALSIWVLRAGLLAQKRPQFHDEIPRLLNNERLDFLFTYTVDYWNEAGSPLSNSLKDLFTKLVSLLRRYDSQSRFQQWAAIALQVQSERRVRYYLLEILSKELHKTQFIIQQDPLFIEKSLAMINFKGLGGLIGRCVGSVMKKLYRDEEHAEEWVSQYWPAVIKALKNPEISDGVQHHTLPVLFKISSASFKLVVDQINDDTELLISCLNIGQLLAIESEPFPHIVSRETIEELLVHAKYKIKIFQLLTFSPKGSRPINPQVFELLKRYIGLFFVDTEIETRMEFISMFKKFLYRLKDSAYALHRDATKMMEKEELRAEAQEKFQNVESCKDFLQWVIQFIKTLILPGSQYQRVSSGLAVLRQIVESNLDEKIPFKIDINYPFKISIFDDVLKRLVLDTVLSTYDDIRANAVYLLNVSKTEWTQEEKDCVIARGFEMLSDYTRSDSGAKILEMCSQLFNNSTIYDRLIKEIPLTSDIQEGVKHPVDGYFQAIRLILGHNKQGKDPHILIDLCERNWDFVKDILVSNSPEGCDDFGVGSGQLVLSYGWRSTKEATLLLEQVLDMEITDEDILKIGEHTLDQLARIRHRGAFSSVYPTFIKIASICLKRMPEQNRAWLDANIDLIQTKTQLITRRSGGLPYLITAIVSVDRCLIPYAFEKLFEIASIPVNVAEESEKMDIAQVHAFNCIKTLFIESQLADHCAPYFYRGLELAITSFNSKIWSVRNCSIMLFTALQNRLFGRKKLSARVFFSRFKGIDAILIKLLKESSDDLETLFPVLTILSKLDSTPGYHELDAFLPLIRNCLETKHWKIRECASRALPALVTDVHNEALLLLDGCSIKDQNKLHGYLLALKVLNYTDDEVSYRLFQLVQELLINNQCFATKKAFVDVLALTAIPQDLKSVLKSVFIEDNSVYEIDGSKQLYLQELFKLVIDDEILDLGMESPFFEVKLEAINYCQAHNIEHSGIDKIAKDDEEFTYARSRTIPLVEHYDSDKVLEFATNQELYGEDIKRSCLELLGSIAAEDSSRFEQWATLIQKNSDDDEPFTVRMSALKSCLRFLELEKKNARVHWFVYQFLTDDDYEARDLASTVFSTGVEPWINAKSFADQFGKTEEELSVVVGQCLKFQPEFKALGNGKVLFNIEKQNLYRNAIEQRVQLAQMLNNGKSILTKDQSSRLFEHFMKIRDSLQLLIETNGHDGVLGWSNNEALFEDIYSTGVLLKQVGIETTELHQAAQTRALHVALYRNL